jgi:hypothetical protein
VKRGATLIAIAIVVAVPACGGNESGGDEEIAVPLSELAGSGQSGTATLIPVGDGRTQVVVKVDDPPAEAQPAHVHPGTCADLDPLPAYALSSVEGGESDTTLDVSLDDLREGDFAINVHRSAEEIRVSVACGEIP